MVRKNDLIIKFISENETNELLPAYFDKCYENLKDLNKSEEKFTVGLVLLVFLHIVFSKDSISSLNIGPISVKDISIIPKLLPILTTYVLFNMYAIEKHKANVLNAIKIYSYTFYKQDYKSEHLKKMRTTFITKLYLPFSFSVVISSLLDEKPSLIKSIMGFIILLPTIVLGLLPFYFLYQMLKTIFYKYYDDSLGFYSFWVSLWVFILIMFYIISETISENKADKNFYSKN
jgi:hypothetical protein